MQKSESPVEEEVMETMTSSMRVMFALGPKVGAPWAVQAAVEQPQSQDAHREEIFLPPSC